MLFKIDEKSNFFVRLSSFSFYYSGLLSSDLKFLFISKLLRLQVLDDFCVHPVIIKIADKKEIFPIE